MFTAMILFIPVLWFAPWWGFALLCFVLGWILCPDVRKILLYSVIAGLVWSALAFIKDGQNGGIISKRLAGLFNLPSWGFVYLIVFAVAFVTTILCTHAGAVLSVLYKRTTV